MSHNDPHLELCRLRLSTEGVTLTPPALRVRQAPKRLPAARQVLVHLNRPWWPRRTRP
jgi:hypothetical protein